MNVSSSILITGRYLRPFIGGQQRRQGQTCQGKYDPPIQGRQDQYGTLAQIDVVEARSYAPVERLVLEECRHAPHLDQPEAVLAAVAEFTARLERIERAEPLGA